MMRFLTKKLLGKIGRSPEERLRDARLIACDIDGTLLNRDEMIAPVTAALIERVEAIGVPFILITRRHHQAAEQYAEELGLRLPLISLDGAITQALHSQAPLATIPFDQDFALDICDEIAVTAGVQCVVVTPDLFLSTESDVPLPSHHEHWNIETAVVESFDTAAGSILEVLASGSYLGVNAVLRYVEEKMKPGEVHVRIYESHSRNDTWYLEVRAARATKYNALVRLVEEHGIRMGNVIGIGDHYNDLEFCRESGYVVAVRNAVSELRSMADFVTERSCDDNGIEEFLRYFLQVRGVDPDARPNAGTQRRRSR